MFSLRFLSVAVGIWVKILCSSAYAFSMLTPTLKKVLQVDQIQIQKIGLLGNIGQYFGFFAGFCYYRFGPRLTMLIGTLLSSAGFLCMWLAVSGHITCSLWGVGAFYAIATQSQPWFDTSSLMTNMYNFEGPNVPILVGLDKTFNGLGASVLTSVYDGAFAVDDADVHNSTILPNGVQLDTRDESVIRLLFFMFAFPLVVGIIGSILLTRETDRVRARPVSVPLFVYGYIIALMIATLTLTKTITQEFIDWHYLIKHVFLVVIGVLLLSYFIMPVAEWRGLKKWGGNIMHSHSVENPTLKESLSGGREHERSATVELVVDPPLDLNLCQCLQSLNFWLVFYILVIGAGVGLSVINNVAQMYFAIGGQHGKESLFVSLISVASAFGRMSTGLCLYKFKHWRASMFFVVYMLLMCIAQLLLALPSLAALSVGSFVTGFCFGGYWAIMPLICKDVAGETHIAKIYNFLNFAPMLGSLLLSAELTATLYQSQVKLHPATYNGIKLCVSDDGACFRTSSFVLAGLCGSAFIAACILKRRV